MSSEAPRATIITPRRSILVSVMAWLTIAIGALATPISVLSFLMVRARSYGTSSSDPLGFLAVVVAPPATLLAGIGLLRRQRWARYFLLVLLGAALLYNVIELFRGSTPQSSYVSPIGVPTTVLATPASSTAIPGIVICTCVIAALLSPQVRLEFSVSKSVPTPVEGNSHGSLDAGWEFAGAVHDGESFKIGGIDVWQHSWTDTGERVNVQDPHHHQAFTFYVYEIASSEGQINFAAGEFSNSIWGFYVRKPTHA
jgi:hypothetical protein